MNTLKYKTKGTCSQQIDIELKDGVIDSVKFTGGATATCRESAPL